MKLTGKRDNHMKKVKSANQRSQVNRETDTDTVKIGPNSMTHFEIFLYVVIIIIVIY